MSAKALHRLQLRQAVLIGVLLALVGMSPAAAQSTGACNDSPPATIAGQWASNWGAVTLSISPQGVVTGYWDQPNAGRGAITGGRFDAATGQLDFSFFQPWNREVGTATLKLSANKAELAGQWAHTTDAGGWTMTRYVGPSDEAMAAARKKDDEFYKTYAANRLPQDIVDYIALFTGPRLYPNLDQKKEQASQLARRRSDIETLIKTYNADVAKYVNSWARLQRGLGLGPSDGDKKDIDDKRKELSEKIPTFNNEYIGLRNMVTTSALSAADLQKQMSSLLARAEADYASIGCISGGEFEALLQEWRRILSSLDRYARDLPHLDQPEIAVPDTLDDVMVPVREKAKEDLARLQELAKGLGEVLEGVDPETRVLIAPAKLVGVTAEIVRYYLKNNASPFK